MKTLVTKCTVKFKNPEIQDVVWNPNRIVNNIEDYREEINSIYEPAGEIAMILLSTSQVTDEYAAYHCKPGCGTDCNTSHLPPNVVTNEETAPSTGCKTCE
jgi:hypothetical protein